MGSATVSVFEKYRSECVPDDLVALSTFAGTLIDSVPLGGSGSETLTVVEGGEVSAMLGTTHAITFGGIGPGDDVRIPWLFYWANTETCAAPATVAVTVQGLAPSEAVGVTLGPGCGAIAQQSEPVASISLHPWCTRPDGSFTAYAESADSWAANANVASGTTSLTLSLAARASSTVDVTSTVPSGWLPFSAESEIYPLSNGLSVNAFSRVSTFPPQSDASYDVDHVLVVEEATHLRYIQRFASGGWLVEVRRVEPLTTAFQFSGADWSLACDPGSVANDGSTLVWEHACADADVLVLGVPGAWAGYYPAGSSSVTTPYLPGFTWTGRTVHAGVIVTDPSIEANEVDRVFDVRHFPDLRVMKSYRGLSFLEY